MWAMRQVVFGANKSGVNHQSQHSTSAIVKNIMKKFVFLDLL